MNILITGAGGFLGRRLAASLLRQGAHELSLHFRQHVDEQQLAGLRAEFPECVVQGVTGNLLDPAAMAGLFAHRPHCLVHAAAGMRGAVADMFANSVIATRNLLDAAVQHGVRRVMLVSSFAVYESSRVPVGGVLDESVPLESVGLAKGNYGYAKTQQEHLFWRYQASHGFEGVVVRPGVIYGPGGGAISPRVGLQAFGLFFRLGGRGLLPLTYVDNCADAIACATLSGQPGQAYSVVDDDLPSCAEFLRQYRAHVKPVKVVPVPRWAFRLGSRFLVYYHKQSKGQMPAPFTPYVVDSMYRPLRYSNTALKHIGWQPAVRTAEGLQRHWAALAASKTKS
jgi:nucleoside-diphosphate-sugar epimerase